jgi:hypothetical protein
MKSLPWILLALALGLMLLLALALAGTENARHAMMSQACPVIHGEVDRVCMDSVSSREHWWQHLAYAMTHLRP